MKKDNKNESKGNIVIYDNKLDVTLDNETVWLSQQQMSELFDTSRENVTMHIKNIFSEDELDSNSVCKDFLHTATDGKNYKTKFYNLDMIISLGYRVKSNTATKFRIWATNTLKQHLIDGYTINDKRLDQLDKYIEILGRSENEMISGVSDILANFTSALDLLDNYDHQNFAKPEGEKPTSELSYNASREFVDSMKFSVTSELFGSERGESFQGIIGQIYQSFAGQEIYPTIEEKAANLLYFCVKDHPFVDGNKRIAAGLFIYFLNINGRLKDKQNNLIIDNNSLAATTLMLALSKPEEKELMVLLVMNMLSGDKSNGGEI
jgi:prophage maintenance system killer protein